MRKGKCVLVVDDIEAIRKVELDSLEAAGYEVEEADGGASAIEHIKVRVPDLVLLDLTMPGVNGWDVLEFITMLVDPPRVVIVSGQHEIVPPGKLSQSIAGYVLKPFDLDQLVQTCDHVLAAPTLMAPVKGTRSEPRRTFVIETTLLSDSGVPLALGKLLDVSRSGFRLELAIPLGPGDRLRVAVHIPGRLQPLTLSGQVRWRNTSSLGVIVDNLSTQDEALLRELVEPEDSESRPE